MKLFKIAVASPDGPIVQWAGTLAEAKTTVREKVSKGDWPETVVEGCEVQLGKAGVVAALNRDPIITEVFCTWGVTARGALKEEK